MRIILISILLMMLVYMIMSSEVKPAFAADTPNIEPSVKTNKNKKTDYLKQNLGDMDAFEANLKNQGSRQLNNMHFNAADFGFDENEVNAQNSKLKSINAHDIENKGREEQQKQIELIRHLHPDYSAPENRIHQSRAESIATDTLKSITDLEKVLQNVGIECRDQNGNIQALSKYDIETKKQIKKDILYEKYICEEKSDTYKCADYLTLECAEYGVKYNPAKQDSIIIAFQEIPNNLWHYSGHDWDTKTWTGWFKRYDFINSKASHKNIQHLISKNIGINFYNIHVPNQNIIVTTAPDYIRGYYEWQRNAIWNRPKKRSFFGYRTYGRDNLSYASVRIYYYTGDKMCKKWHESWQERCSLTGARSVRGIEE